MYQYLNFDQNEGIVTLTLNRPEVYNAFNDELTFELQDAIKKISKDDDVRVVVITGAGKAFSSGQDLKAALLVKNRSYSESVKKRYNPLIKGIRNLPKPVICKLNGVAAGAGCSLALACDLIIASEEASLIQIFINIGLVLDSGASYFLPRLVGYAKSFELSTMGTPLKAEEALKLGLVNKVVPAAQLDEAVKVYTDYYENAPTKSIGIIKKMINKSENANLEEMLEYEAYCQDIAGSSLDHQEGVMAFMEKRKPQFKGR
ncbi:MAG: enoyl-CoA hydratase-related protein [Bacteroidota bacterium]|nr:enoyl-CoA hydratase-related protein [Bacteroidota bacterium]